MHRGFAVSYLVIAAATCAWAQPKFTASEILGRATNRSVTVNAEADADLEVYVEYGKTSGTYTAKTAVTRAPAGKPFEVALDQLEANTRYYYRLQYRAAGGAEYTARAERTFQTQRPRGSTFTFAVEFDPHMDENSDAATYSLTLANALADKPDFFISLGDTFMSDKLNPVTEAAVLNRVRLLRSYYDKLCHSAPIFLALGNHEGEWGRNLNANGQNVAVWDTNFRKQYIPNPLPDSFFSGDATAYPTVGQRQAFFAWEWGDALFVVLDPYWALPVSPEQSGDWSVTLGRPQYDWLKKTLENSTATYKFVFAHNLVGGVNPNGLGPMRGGIEQAKFLEWGGYNLDGTWGFDKARPGWPMPIHQLLVANNVTMFLHGHDHLYAKQDLDGIVYLEGPQPSAKNVNLGTRATDYTYTHGTLLGGTGYLRVEVSPAGVKADYVQTWIPSLENAKQKNAMVADTFSIAPRKTNLRMLSAASYAGGNVAPESIVAAFGDGLKDAKVKVTDSAGTERSAIVLGSSAAQVNFVVPAGTAAGRAQVSAGNALGDLTVDTVAPGLFSANANGTGAAAAVAIHAAANGTQTSEMTFQCGTAIGSCKTVAVDMGGATDQLYLSLYGTGLRNRNALADVTATVGGVNAPVQYAGPQSGFVGLDQVNVQVPRSVAGKGEVPVVVTVSGRVANTVTVNIK